MTHSSISGLLVRGYEAFEFWTLNCDLFVVSFIDDLT